MILIYKTKSGEYVSDLDVKKSFNIISGLDWEEFESEYLKFLNKLLNSSLVFLPDISDSEILEFRDVRLAIEKYQEKHSCSQEEARYMYSKLLSKKWMDE